MKVTTDQPKEISARETCATKGVWTLELVTFSTAFGLAYGCRVFSELQSGVTDLYDNKDEPLGIAQAMMKTIVGEVDVQELAGMSTSLPYS